MLSLNKYFTIVRNFFFPKKKKLCYDNYKNREIKKKFRGGSMKKGFKAIDFANWFLWYNEIQQIQQENDDDYDVYEGLTHLKIQKLLYYAEGINLAVTGDSLFKEKIYAWPHGPVVKEVYELLHSNGKKEISFNQQEWETIEKINDNIELYDVLVTTYDSYAGYTAWQLREKSHVAGGPWQVTVDNIGMLKEISKDLIKNYFIRNVVKIDEK